VTFKSYIGYWKPLQSPWSIYQEIQHKSHKTLIKMTISHTSASISSALFKMNDSLRAFPIR